MEKFHVRGQQVPITLDAAGELPTSLVIWPVGLQDTSKGFDIIDERAIELMGAAWSRRGHEQMSFDLAHGMFGFAQGVEQAQNYGLFTPVFDKQRGVVAESIQWAPEIVDKLKGKRIRYWSPCFLPEFTDDGYLVHVEAQWNGAAVHAIRPAELLNVALTDMPATNGQQPIVKDRSEVEEIMKKKALRAEEAPQDEKDPSSEEDPKEEKDSNQMEMETLKAENAKLLARIAELEKVVKEYGDEKEESERSQIVDALVEDGLIAESLDEFWRSQGIEMLRSFDEKVRAAGTPAPKQRAATAERKAPQQKGVTKDDNVRVLRSVPSMEDIAKVRAQREAAMKKGVK